MSRDHYKGVPKTRDAKLDKDGKLIPLSNKEEESSVVTSLRTVMSESPKSRINIYARATGHDTNGDGTLENPYRTFYQCMKDIPLNLDGRVVYIDISGIGVETREQITVSMPPVVGGGSFYQNTVHPLPEFAGSPHWQGAINIVASPTVLHSFNVDSVPVDPLTNNASLVSTGAGWTPDEFKGKFVTKLSSGTMYVIFSNTEDTLHVGVGSFGFDGADVSIVESSASLQYGQTTRPEYSTFTPNFDLSPLKCSLSVWGVDFLAPAGGLHALTYHTHDTVAITGSRIEGLNWKGTAFCEFDGVYFPPGFYIIWQGATWYLRHSYIHNPGYFSLGGNTGEPNTIYNSQFEGLDRFPHRKTMGDLFSGGSAPLTLKHTTVVSGTNDGVTIDGGVAVTMDYVHIKDCAGHGIHAGSGATLTVRRVRGTGNTGYGINVQDGSQVAHRDTVTAVTGDLGDFKVGVLPTDTWANYHSGFSALLDTTAVSGTMSRMFTPGDY